jgi:hypothetical protein
VKNLHREGAGTACLRGKGKQHPGQYPVCC